VWKHVSWIFLQDYKEVDCKLKKRQNKERFIPFILTLIIVLLDQISKAIVISLIPLHVIGLSIFGGFIRIIHTRNLGIAFSMGRSFPDTLRSVLFILLPVVVLTGLMIYYFRSEDISSVQRWAFAGVLGGGLGNLIDRVFRPSGVVDFIDVKFYGILGLDRWPTWNLADASLVVSGIVLVFSFIMQEGLKKHEQKD